MTIIIGIIVVFCYVSMHLIETASFGSRAAGRLSNNLALGTTIHYSLYTASRFMLVFLLPGLGFLVESGIDFQGYFAIVISSLIISSIFSYLILVKFNSIQFFFQKVFIAYKESSIPMAFYKAIFNSRKFNNATLELNSNFNLKAFTVKKLVIAFCAYCFLSSGFFVSFLLAMEFTEYRLTFSQFTAAFHGIGALIVSFYLDPMLSRSIDFVQNKDEWLMDLYSIVFGRVLAYLATSLMFLTCYFIFY